MEKEFKPGDKVWWFEFHCEPHDLSSVEINNLVLEAGIVESYGNTLFVNLDVGLDMPITKHICPT